MTELVWQRMSISFISVSKQKNLGRYSVQMHEGPEFKADLAKLEKELEGGYDAGGVAAFSKKENLGKEEFVHDQVTFMY